MSLILDALNKADNERSHNDAPSIHSNHDTEINGRGIRRPQKLILLASIVTILLASAIVFFLTIYSSDKTAVAQIQPNKQNLPPTDRYNTPATISPTDAPVDTKKATPRKIDALKERVIAAQYQQAHDIEKNIKTKKNAPASELNNLERTEKTEQQVKAIYQQKTTAISQAAPKPQPTLAVNAVQSTPSPRRTPRATPKPSTTLAKHSLLSFISELPYAIQKNIPTIMYTRHKYRSEGDSFVRLNNVEFRQGQQVAEKLYIEEVLRDGIVLRYNNRKFKMKALNSWVNM